MRKLVICLSSIIIIFFGACPSYGSDFKGGERVSITEPVIGDLYVAAGEIDVRAPISGDLVVAGGEISVEDSVMQDILIAGGQLYLNGFVGDDIRAAGGRIKITNRITGDLVVFGGEINIQEDAIIDGDLRVFGGEVYIRGVIKGAIKSSGGKIYFRGTAEGDVELQAEELEIDGEIKGRSTLVAENIILGDQAKFYQEVEYWREDAEMDFGTSLVNTSARYDIELKEIGKDRGPFGLAFGPLGLIYVLSILLILILLNFLFNRPLAQAGERLNQEPTRSLGYGAAYFIGLPILVVLLLVTVIGIPIALLFLALYAFSLLFGLSITSVVAAKAMKIKYNYKHWGTWMLVLVSAGVFVVLKLLTLIPFIGWLFYLIVLVVAFGAILVDLLPQKKIST